MNAINLTEDEATALQDVLKYYLNELQTEITHTDDRGFKAALKNRQATLQDIIKKLAVTTQTA